MSWRLLYVRPGAEKKVMSALQEIRYDYGAPLEVYMPVERVWRGLGPRRCEYDRPLIRSILFANVPDSLLPLATHAAGVHRLVLANMADTLKLTAFIGELRAKEAEGVWDRTAKKPLKVGQNVRVASGKWAGLLGQIAGLDGARRVHLITSLFGRAGKMTIEAERLECAEDTPNGQLVAA